MEDARPTGLSEAGLWLPIAFHIRSRRHLRQLHERIELRDGGRTNVNPSFAVGLRNGSVPNHLLEVIQWVSQVGRCLGDSSDSPVQGEQKGAAWYGGFQSKCLHPPEKKRCYSCSERPQQPSGIHGRSACIHRSSFYHRIFAESLEREYSSSGCAYLQVTEARICRAQQPKRGPR